MATDAGNAVVAGLRLFYLDYPAVVLAVVSLFFHFTWWKILIAVLLLLGAAFWQVVVGSCYNFWVYLQLYYGYLLRFRECSFARRPLNEFASDSFIRHLLVERLGISRTKHELGYVCVVRRKVIGARWPSAMSSFPLETLPWYIMVTDSADELTPHQRFMLLHELGHVALFHRIALERKISTVFQAGFLLGVVLLTTSAEGLVLGAIAGLVAIWCAVVVSRSVPTLLFEQLADRFALLFLAAEDVAQISSEDFRSYTQFADAEERDRRQASFDEALAARRAVTTPDALIDRQNAFNRYALDRFWPQWHAYAVIGAAVLISAFHSTGGTPGSRVATAVVALVLPTLAFFVVRTGIEVFRWRVDLIMEMGYVSSALVSPAFLAWERRRMEQARGKQS